jgi:hypothetical protein
MGENCCPREGNTLPGMETHHHESTQKICSRKKSKKKTQILEMGQTSGNLDRFLLRGSLPLLTCVKHLGAQQSRRKS